MELDKNLSLKRLERPCLPVDVVLDTDAYNEIDDQFALAYLIKSEEQLHLKAIYAAPFYNEKSSGPEDGMLLSYKEILKILTLIGRGDLSTIVHRGATCFLPSELEPVPSDAANHLVELADRYSPCHPLYVIAIGAITNVASALLIKPEIKKKIVVIWLGGHSLDWHDNEEFNLSQDVAAARIVFGCGVPVIQLPCMGVVSAFTVSGPELEHWLLGKSSLCDYLIDVTSKQALADGGLGCWTRPIWDVAAVGWLLDPSFMLDRLETSPIPQYDYHYSRSHNRHFIRYVYHIHRDALMTDLLHKLSNECKEK